MTDPKKRRFTLLFVAALCAPALGFSWVSDDQHVIVDGKLIGSLRNLPALWAHDMMYNSDLGDFGRTSRLDTYRPLTMTTFALDHALWGRRPAGYHLTSLLLHLLATALLLRFAEGALGSCTQGCLVALGFGVHPLLTEAYAWIAGRSDALAAVLVLGALLLLERAEVGKPRLAVWGGLLLLLGGLAKETALLCALPLLVRPTTLRPRRPASCLAVVGAAGFCVLLRAVVLSGLRVGSPAHVSDALRVLPWVLGEGIAGTFVPHDTTIRFLLEDMALGGAWGWAARAAVLVGTGVLAYRLRHRRLLVFGLASFLLLLAPVALVVSMRWFGFGRYLYLPAAFLLPGAIGALGGLRRGPLIAGAWIGALALSHLLCLGDWRDNERLYAAAIRDQPAHSHGWGALGAMRVAHGDVRRGLPLLETAVHKGLPNPRWMRDLADAYMRAGRPADAIAVAGEGLRRFPTDAGLLDFWRRVRETDR
jgi:protein O-mannosyl-transferase